MSTTWASKENAEAYDAYARKYSQYQVLGKKLIELAAIRSGMRVYITLF